MPALGQTIGINVVLKTSLNNGILADLGTHGKVRDIVPEINAVTMLAKASELATIQALPYVAAANPDQKRNTGPVNAAAITNFDNGYSSWNLDAINVTYGPGPSQRAVAFDGTGVNVAVLDTGLVDNWPSYFLADRIAVQYARSFSGGGAQDVGATPDQPNKWEHDQNSHGTHVTSTILGFRYGSAYFTGVAPNATVIPVKVLNQNGSGWSSVIARGMVYIADLKAGELSDKPMVINMSLGGPDLDAMEKAAIDYAISKGVIIVAAAGNEGDAGMGYPGAYAPVISVAAVGWAGEWTPVSSGSWWYILNVADPTNAADFYITDFSSRQKTGQELDVAAPGSWVVGPYQVNGQISYYYLGGTSMATPHVTGVVALMAQKKAALTAAEAQGILESTAVAMPASCTAVRPGPGLAPANVCWGADAPGAGLVQADKALDATF